MAHTSKEDWWQKKPATGLAFLRYVPCPSCKCRARSGDIGNPWDILNPGQTPVPMHWCLWLCLEGRAQAGCPQWPLTCSVYQKVSVKELVVSLTG